MPRYRRYRRFSAEVLEGRRMLTAAPEILLDINPGNASGEPYFAIPSLFNKPTVFEGNLYFAANDGEHGFQVWKSDGTADGTEMLTELDAPEDTFPAYFTEFGGELYFGASTEEHGDELWKTDGTREGTTIVKDLLPGAESSLPEHLHVLNGELYFTTYEPAQLWKTDGTADGTVAVADVTTDFYWNLIGSRLPNLDFFTTFNGKLYFSAIDEGGTELWSSDGTEAGTGRLADLHAGPNPSYPLSFVEHNQELYFLAGDELNPNVNDQLVYHLWKTDGSPDGTTRVSDTPVQPNGGMAAYGNSLYLAACTDGFAADGNVMGCELHRTTETGDAIELVKDTTTAESGGDPRWFAVAGESLYFAAIGPDGRELWKTDGTADGTQQVRDLRTGPDRSSPNNLIELNGQLYFQADDGNGWELWTSDGTEDGTVRVSDLQGGDHLTYAPMVAFNGGLYFSADDGVHGTELWVFRPEIGSLTGDINLDGEVSFGDFLTLSNNFGAVDATFAEGDLDGNGEVDFADFLLLSSNFGAQLT